MVVGNNKSTTTKNAGKLLAILIPMRMRRYNGGCIAQWSTSRLHWEPLYAAIGYRASVSAVSPRRPPWSTNSLKHTQIINTKIFFFASNYGTNWSLLVYENFITQNESSTQFIDATSFVEMCDTTIGAEELAEELAHISSYQMLSADKNATMYQASMKIF